MKYLSIRHILIAISTAFTFSSCTISSHTEKTSGLNFLNYKTFGWSDSINVKKTDRVDNDIVDNNIKNSISEALEKRGWKEVDDNPDVKLDYTVAVKEFTSRMTDYVNDNAVTDYVYTNTDFDGIINHAALQYANSATLHFKEALLTINMVDVKTKKLAWQGSAEGEIGGRYITAKKATGEVKSIFKKFDFPVKK